MTESEAEYAMDRDDPFVDEREVTSTDALLRVGSVNVALAVHDLTVVAVPTGALERLRAAWEDLGDEEFARSSTRLIRDVFGGIDGHLTRIDEVLPERNRA